MPKSDAFEEARELNRQLGAASQMLADARSRAGIAMVDYIKAHAKRVAGIASAEVASFLKRLPTAAMERGGTYLLYLHQRWLRSLGADSAIEATLPEWAAVLAAREVVHEREAAVERLADLVRQKELKCRLLLRQRSAE